MGRKKCGYCAAGWNGRALGRRQYQNASKDAGRFAGTMAHRCQKRGAAAKQHARLRQTCGTPCTMSWGGRHSHQACQHAQDGHNLKDGKEDCKADAEKIARVLRAEGPCLSAACRLPTSG